MKRPYIYLCGDRDKCRSIVSCFKGRIKAVFAAEKNSKRLLDTPKAHPALICIIFGDGMYANTSFFKKIYEYSARSRCPVHIAGSRRNIETAVKLAQGAYIQRSSIRLIHSTIEKLCEYAASDSNGDLMLLKSRFQTAAVISDNAPTLALYEGKISQSPVKPRIITASEKCEGKEFELLKAENLSEIITDCPPDNNALALFNAAAEKEAPAILLNRRERYGRRYKIHYLDSRTENGRAAQLLTEYSRRRSKLLYLRNK